MRDPRIMRRLPTVNDARYEFSLSPHSTTLYVDLFFRAPKALASMASANCIALSREFDRRGTIMDELLLTFSRRLLPSPPPDNPLDLITSENPFRSSIRVGMSLKER